MTEDGGPAPTPCRFCGRPPGVGQHRVSGPRGPICADCVESGLRLTGTRGQAEGEHEHLLRLDAREEGVCELCDRGERLSFLGRRRPLRRVRSTTESHAVVCADCLDWAGDLINKAIRG